MKKTSMILPLRLTAFFLRVTARLLAGWPVLLIAAFILSPVGPHLRWDYQVHEGYGRRIYSQCSYLGSHGIVRAHHFGDCPIILWLDSRAQGGKL